MGIKESNWLLNKLSKGLETNPYTPEELARIARERSLNENSDNAINQYVAGRLAMVRRDWNHLREIFGWVPPTHMEFSAKLTEAKRALDIAYYSKYFGLIDPTVADTIQSVRSPVSEIAMRYKTVSGNIETADNVVKIMSTCEALSIWANTSLTDPEYAKKSAEAAHHFDNLFGYLSGFVKGLPPPLGAFAVVFSQISSSSFFTNMQKRLSDWYSGPGSLHDPSKAFKN